MKSIVFPEETPKPGQLTWCPISHPSLNDERRAMLASGKDITREVRDKQLESYCATVGWPRQHKKMEVCVGWARRASSDICTRLYMEKRVQDLMKNYARSKVASGRLLIITDSLRDDLKEEYDYARIKVEKKEVASPGSVVGAELSCMPLWWRVRVGVWRHNTKFQDAVAKALATFDRPNPADPKLANVDQAPVQVLLLAGNHSTEVILRKESPAHLRDFLMFLDIELDRKSVV